MENQFYNTQNILSKNNYPPKYTKSEKSMSLKKYCMYRFEISTNKSSSLQGHG